jgi:ADP-heptose:LPS heptosyltransferase
VIERFADLFEPELCEVYARLFSHVISRALPEYSAEDLYLRYRRVRQVRKFAGGEVSRVFVLSRITLGADVAVTSVAIAAAKERFPNAEICLVAPLKNAELYLNDPRVVPISITYGRSALLRDRLLAAAELHVAVDEFSSVVIDPDSRLTQLGLIPICDDARYYFFESRAYGFEGSDTLPRLTARWLSEVFDTPAAAPFVAPQPQPRIADVTVSWGVGDNSAKRIDDDFELEVLSALLSQGRSVLLDRGAGGEEAQRIDLLAERLGHPPLLHIHDGSYAGFASHIAQSKLYVGYDSAGQHVASAARVPLLSVFAGYACERMFERWRPAGPHVYVINVDESNRSSVLVRTLAAIAEVSQEVWSAAEARESEAQMD